jgi:antitoxin (DNA-binding transcriptional repressor) of toxin-antitoxin stability system
MKMTATELRANLYRVLDAVLATGEPVEIERQGRTLRIVADAPRVPATEEELFARLTPHPDCIIGDPDDLVHMDWSDEWKP